MKANNGRITREERLALAAKAAKEAEGLKNKNNPPEPSPSPTPAPEPTPGEPHASPSTTPSPSPTPPPPSPSASPSAPPPEPTPEPEPFKKKFVASQREAIVLHGKQKQMNQAIDQANAIADPTEEEMRVEYPEWDDMTEPEKRTAIKTVKNDKRFAILNTARQAERNVEEWHTKVDTFIGDPKTLIAHPELEGKQAEFILFASQPTRVGTDFTTLVEAFMYNVEKTKTSSQRKREMFPSGQNRGSSRPAVKSDKISLDEARRLRESKNPADNKKYLAAIKAHKIDNSL